MTVAIKIMETRRDETQPMWNTTTATLRQFTFYVMNFTSVI